MKCDDDVDIVIGEVGVHVEDVEVDAAALAGSKCTVWCREHPRHHGEGGRGGRMRSRGYEEGIYEELVHMVTNRTAQGGWGDGEEEVRVDEVGDNNNKVESKVFW